MKKTPVFCSPPGFLAPRFKGVFGVPAYLRLKFHHELKYFVVKTF